MLDKSMATLKLLKRASVLMTAHCVCISEYIDNAVLIQILTTTEKSSSVDHTPVKQF